MLRDGSEDSWMPWFAWLPVWVDAYHVTEIDQGRFHYRVWLRRVEYAFSHGSKENPVWKYRLPPIPTMTNGDRQ
jgi:hypothetical protein